MSAVQLELAHMHGPSLVPRPHIRVSGNEANMVLNLQNAFEVYAAFYSGVTDVLVIEQRYIYLVSN